MLKINNLWRELHENLEIKSFLGTIFLKIKDFLAANCFIFELTELENVNKFLMRRTDDLREQQNHDHDPFEKKLHNIKSIPAPKIKDTYAES